MLSKPWWIQCRHQQHRYGSHSVVGEWRQWLHGRWVLRFLTAFLVALLAATPANAISRFGLFQTYELIAGGGSPQFLPYTVATLPACTGPNLGLTEWVTDAAPPVNGTIVGGGSNTTLAICSGVHWVPASPTAVASLGYTPLNPTNNLSELTSAPVAVGNLGLNTTVYATHAALIAGTIAAPLVTPWTLQQNEFTAGLGGGATYVWNAASTCPTGMSTSGDGIICILPSGQAAGTPGRYIIQFPDGEINARAIGMTPATSPSSPFDNHTLLPTLMAAISASYAANAGAIVRFDGTPGYNNTTEYYFSNTLDITRNMYIKCQGVGIYQSTGVNFVFAAGVDGVDFEQNAVNNVTSDGGSSRGQISGCGIVQLAKGSVHTTAGSGTIANLAVNNSPTITAPIWASGDGIVGAMGSHTNAIGEDITPGAYFQSVVGSTGTLATNFQTANTTTAESIYRLPAALSYNITTTLGSDTFVMQAGSSTICLNQGDMIWSDAFPYGAQIWNITGACGSQTANVISRFLTTGTNLPALVDHNGSTPGIYGPDVAGATSGTASASSTYTAQPGYTAPLAFKYGTTNEAPTTGWANNNILPAWLEWDLGSGNSATVTSYSLSRGAGGAFTGNNPSPSNWTFLGSNDATTCSTGSGSWTTLDTETSRLIIPAIQYILPIVPPLTSATTAAGNNVLTFAGAPTGITAGYPVVDVTARVIPAGTVVTNVAGGSVTISNNVTGAGVGLGDEIEFAGPTYYAIASPASYRCYQLNITAAVSGNYVNIGRLTLNTASTATGKLWKIPAGLKHKFTSSSDHISVDNFPIGIQLSCNSVNCTGSTDTYDFINGALEGRWVAGNNAGASYAIGNAYADNAIHEIFEGGAIGSDYFGESSNSGEFAPFQGSCNSQNASIYLGDYIENEGAPYNYCLTSGGGAYQPVFIGGLVSGVPLDLSTTFSGALQGPWTAAYKAGSAGAANGTVIINTVNNGLLGVSTTGIVGETNPATVSWSWDGTTKAWRYKNGSDDIIAALARANTVYPGDGLSYAGFERPILLSGLGTYNTFTALGAAQSVPVAPTNPKQGDFYLNQNAAVGSPIGWINTNPSGWTASPVGVVSSFSGTKTAGSCVFTIVNGVITNVTGC
jgi:hypothetical protein